MGNKYDIFISYRRRDAGDKAEHLKDLLEPYYKGRISFDRENLTGKFNVQLIERIDHVKDFLLVIGKKSLSYNDEDRNDESVTFCNELISLSQDDFAKRINELGPDANIDYVRIEIGRALRRHDLHIIPIVPERSESFNFASLNLPSDIAGIKNYEAVFYSDSPDALFKDIVPKVRKHLKSKPNLMLPKKTLGILCLVIIMFLACIIYMCIDSSRKKKQEELRSSKMEQLEKKYSSIGLNFYKNDTITIGQLNAIADILDNMQDVKPDTLKMGMFEVTIGQWNGVMKLPFLKEESLYPKTNISLGDCLNFANVLYELTSLPFEIPTEQDWKYAALGRNDSVQYVYSGSNDPKKVAWYKGNSNGKVHKCDGELEANDYNLFNMSGNVGEICFSNYYADDTDEKRLAYKVVRGGDYSSEANKVTIQSRVPFDQNERSSKVGVRLALRLEQVSNN